MWPPSHQDCRTVGRAAGSTGDETKILKRLQGQGTPSDEQGACHWRAPTSTPRPFPELSLSAALTPRRLRLASCGFKMGLLSRGDSGAPARVTPSKELLGLLGGGC